ncbi:MAG: four helix bundle protein [Bacteroidota bacterium]
MTEYTKLRNINRGYMKLDVWQKAIELHGLAYQIVYNESKVEFKLRAQIADATQSVSANISEGYGRRSIKEYIQHCYIALGSLAEAMARMIGLKVTLVISEEQFQRFDVLHYEVENKLLRLIESLEKKRDDGTWTDRVSEDFADYNP